MCGLTGFVSTSNLASSDLDATCKAMAEAIFSRGPDDQGTWIDPDIGIAMSFRRLAIIDLSSAGHQPMHSSSGRYILCFNGEIYNHLELRKNICSSNTWKGHSDSETLLAVIEKIGIEAALKKCVGMFAIAIWDRAKRKLTLARDRLGEKPLYYGWTNNNFVWGSELKAIKKFPKFDNKISKEALENFLQFSYVPAPKSIYEDIFKLEPASYVEFDCKNILSKKFTIKKYWELNKIASDYSSTVTNDDNTALSNVKDALKESIKLQMVSDVPLGSFLSGGIDSSLITALMQEQSMQKVKTFTIGFEESLYDESPYARDVAEHLGTDHSEYIVTPHEAMDVINDLPFIYDEPFADSSQIPTHLVCKHAKKRVTVALSGDGGDEVFGGYNRYFWSEKIWSKISWIPFPIRQLLGRGGQALPINLLDFLGNTYNYINPGSEGISQFGDKFKKLSNRLQAVQSEPDLYISLVSQFNNPSALISNYEASGYGGMYQNINIKNSSEQMMFWDTMTYLPDDILCKVDRAAMAISLETRAPFLDHRVIEAAWKLPLSLKMNQGIGKIALRKILESYIPNEIIDRPKSGFGIPIGEWIRGPLYDWAYQLLHSDSINNEGYLNYPAIKNLWDEHQSKKFDHTHKIWNILMFQLWLKSQD